MNIHNVIHIYCTHNILENMKNGYIYMYSIFNFVQFKYTF